MKLVSLFWSVPTSEDQILGKTGWFTLVEHLENIAY